jgi:hypothetical protein
MRRSTTPRLLVVLASAALVTGTVGGAGGAAATVPAAAKHRIGVRVVGGSGELVDRRTGKRFVPRGANYIRLGPEGHATFTVGRYDARRAGAALGQMKALGYNSVRVFLGGDCAGCPGAAGGGISKAYARNVADFLRRAKKAGQLVILTTQWLPASYGARIGDSPLVDDVNRIYLTDGGIQAYASFWSDFALELRRQRAPLDVVLAYDIVNEGAMVVDQAPFTLTSGTLRAPGGGVYDLADPAAKERLLGDGLVTFGNRVRSAIRKVDPTALVSASFFVPTAPHPIREGDTRDLRTRPVIERSALDLVDIHLYAGERLPLARLMENYGVAGPTRKPLIIGETGAFRDTFSRASEAASGIAELQMASCSYGIDGWLLWTWDSDEQPELWNARSESGVIGQALSPKQRPDPCKPPPGPRNLALAKPVRASQSLPANPPELAVDGSAGTNWISDGELPQWIEVDLAAPSTISRIELVVSQFPEGNTVHRVWGRDAAGAERLLGELTGFTKDADTLTLTPAQPWQGVRAVRIETVASTSWASWREIHVFGTASG